MVFIAGIGFFVDAYVFLSNMDRPVKYNFTRYDIFSINIASTMLAYVHTQGNCTSIALYANI